MTFAPLCIVILHEWIPGVCTYTPFDILASPCKGAGLDTLALHMLSSSTLPRKSHWDAILTGCTVHSSLSPKNHPQARKNNNPPYNTQKYYTIHPIIFLFHFLLPLPQPHPLNRHIHTIPSGGTLHTSSHPLPAHHHHTACEANHHALSPPNKKNCHNNKSSKTTPQFTRSPPRPCRFCEN